MRIVIHLTTLPYCLCHVHVGSTVCTFCITLHIYSCNHDTSRKMKASVKEPNMFHNYETEKITRKSTAEYIKLFGSSAWDRHADVFSVILWTSTDICVMHDDLGWKNWTTRYNCRFSATSLTLWVIFSGRATKQHVIIGFGELAAVD